MKADILKHFRCPKCGGENLSAPEKLTSAGPNIEPHLLCTCGYSARIKNNIPRFVPESNYANSFGFQWNRHPNAQLDSYSGLPISRKRLFSVTNWNENLEGQRILEAGSGAGRFTEILLQTGALIYSFDYSDAVDANFLNNGKNSRLVLFQGDIFHLPLSPGSFDKVLCLGVIQHTPDPEKAFTCLASMVRPGGELVIDVYANTLAAWMQWCYILRPITKRLNKQTLYRVIAKWSPYLIPVARLLRKIGGRVGARLMPIAEYSHLGLSPQLNKEWVILDTFDIYSPAHDHPQSIATVRRWFKETDFSEIVVCRGPNGVIGKGKKG